MSCSPFDLRDYFLQELPEGQRREVESHVQGCQPCREELDRLRITEAALFSLRDEEIPQRIAFVSDPIFEPSPWRRAFQSFWNSGARLGFASAAMLSIALVVFATTRPAPVIQQAPAVAAVQQPPVQTVSDEQIQARIDAAVSKAVAGVQASQSAKLNGLELRLKLAAYNVDELENSLKRSKERIYKAQDYGPPVRPGESQ